MRKVPSWKDPSIIMCFFSLHFQFRVIPWGDALLMEALRESVEHEMWIVNQETESYLKRVRLENFVSNFHRGRILLNRIRLDVMSDKRWVGGRTEDSCDWFRKLSGSQRYQFAVEEEERIFLSYSISYQFRWQTSFVTIKPLMTDLLGNYSVRWSMRLHFRMRYNEQQQ